MANRKSRLFPGVTGEELIAKMKLHRKEIAAKQYEINGDVIRARCRAYATKRYHANKAAIQAERSTEAYKAYHKKYMDSYLVNNAERLKLYRKEYYLKNKERIDAANKISKAKVREATQ